MASSDTESSFPSNDLGWSQHVRSPFCHYSCHSGKLTCGVRQCGRYNLPGHPAPRMVIHVEGVGDVVTPDPYPNTKLERMYNGVPVTPGESIPVINRPLPAEC
jgi:hypothetical protein